MIQPMLNNRRFTAALEAAQVVFDIPSRTLLGRSRHSAIVMARYAVCLALRDVCGASYPSLGVRFDRDHSTIIYGVEKAARLAQEDAEFAAAIELIAAEVRTA